MLKECVRPLFDLGQAVDDKGTTLRAALESVERQTGKTPDRLATARKPLPLAFQRPMQLWQDLHRGRNMGPMGMGTIGWRDYDAYCRVTGEKLSAGDIAAIEVIEGEYHASRLDADERRAKAAKPK